MNSQRKERTQGDCLKKNKKNGGGGGDGRKI